MFINTSGIVLREVKYGDNTKILTVLTGTEGKLTVSAHGAYRKNSKIAAATGFLVFSHMTLTSRKDNRWTLSEAQTIEQFTGLRDDLSLLALGTYFAELTEALSDEDSPNTQLLPLLLNALYALSENIKPPSLIKPAFELRLMAISGYEPLLEDLSEAGQTLTQSADYEPSKEGVLSLSPKALSAARYILTCNAKKLFSFNLDGNALKELAREVETYLLTHLDKEFKTLDYYKKYCMF